MLQITSGEHPMRIPCESHSNDHFLAFRPVKPGLASRRPGALAPRGGGAEEGADSLWKWL